MPSQVLNVFHLTVARTENQFGLMANVVAYGWYLGKVLMPFYVGFR